MMLISKICITVNKNFDFYPYKKKKIVIAANYLAVIALLLPRSSTAQLPGTVSSSCINSSVQQITHLAAVPKVPTVFNQLNPLIQDLIKVIGTNIALHPVTIEKPLKIYTQVWKQALSPFINFDFDFNSPIQKIETNINNVSLILISGGKPITIHADSRYQVPEILAKSGTNAIAGVDGTFFSLKYLTSNVMIGPVLSQVNNQFIAGNKSENKKLTGRPLVLVSASKVRFIPFDPTKHNTLAGVQVEMADVTDAFVAGAFLVKNGYSSKASSFKNLYGADVARHRAFWGVNKVGVPTIGVSTKPTDSANLAIILAKAGFKDAVMLDSGASTSLAMAGKSLVGYTPRPVPHVVALVPTSSGASNCVIAAFAKP
jgi:Phosphodiester glycosidase